MSTPEKYNEKQQKLGLFTNSHIAKLVEFWQENNGLTVDGYCGPATQQSLNDEMYDGTDIASSLGQMALSVAIGEIGNGEEGGNNSGPHVARYHGIADDGDDDDDGAWCASFVSYCCTTAADSLDITLPFSTSSGAKALYKKIGKAGSFVSTPLPGDVVCWDRGKPGSWQGHIGFVEKLESGILYTIEGNVGRFPSVVHRIKHDLDREDRLIGFARMP